MPKGSAVRLSAPSPTLGAAEGIETALAAWILFGVPTWAAVCANGLATFEPPDMVKRLLIFADDHADSAANGRSRTDLAPIRQRADTETIIPGRPGQDWNDVLRGGR